MPSATLLPEDKTTIRMAIGHECQIFTATIARLYLAYPDPIKWTFISTGAVAFMKDTRKNGSFFFRFVHLQSGAVIWEQEVYRDFKYYQEKPYFHTFFTDQCTAGLSFADENEALSFYSKVMGRENLRIQPRKPAAPVRGTNSASNAPPSGGSGSGGVFSSSKAKSGGGGGGKKKFDKSAIGAPTNFRHLTHVGYDPEKGFSTMNVPPEWKQVFEKAGVTEDQLKDANTAKFIFDFMSQNYGDTPPTPSSANKPQPEPALPPIPAVSAPVSHHPPVPKRTAPPPPPPSRSAAAPAPPSAAPTPRAAPPPVPSRPRPTSEYGAAPPAPPDDLPEPPPMPAEPAPPPMPRSGGPVPAAPPMPPPAPVYKPPATTIPPQTPARKPAAAAPQAAAGDNRGDLLASIRKAGVTSLKPATERELPAKEAAAAAPAGDIAGALRAALMKRQEGTRGDDSDEGGEPEDDDDEW